MGVEVEAEPEPEQSVVPAEKAAGGSNSEDPIGGIGENALPAEQWLSSARNLVTSAAAGAKKTTAFTGKWKLITSKLDRLPSCLSDLSTHPFFSKNTLCKEQLQSMCRTLSEVIELAGICTDGGEKSVGKLQMQSDLDAALGKLDLSIRDCRMLVKSGVLGDGGGGAGAAGGADVRELLARLQIGNVEEKHRAVEGLLEVLKEDRKKVLAVLGGRNVAALVQLLSATTSSAKIREKTATVVCILAESGTGERNLLVSEGALPPLIRLAESGGSSTGREKAVVSLQRLSDSPETAKIIVAHGGARPLIEICSSGESSSSWSTLSQAAATETLRNMSAVPEVRQSLAEEGIIGTMIGILDGGGVVAESKQHAAECLQNLSSGNESLRRSLAKEGGLKSLLAYIDAAPSPEMAPVAALRNLAGSVPTETLLHLGLLPTMVRVMTTGSPGARQAAAALVCKISASSSETKRLVGESGCLPVLVSMLEAKTAGARQVAAQALAGLMCYPQNAREVKKEEKSVPCLVQLLDHSPQNTAKKYAVLCLLWLSPSKRCRKSMVSYGAIGYLKKLAEVDVPGARKLLERLQRGKLKSFLFNRK